MGNSSSSSPPGVHPIHTKWTQSLEPPETRNRMKRSYFQPKGGQPKLPPSAKPLPIIVDPSETRLRPTSNGAILHGGGTISGRKLNELDLRPNPAGTTIATPPIKTSPMTSKSPHDQDAHPPSQFAKFEESRSKKQIRSKKKYPAPLPPAELAALKSRDSSKRLKRIFKTKSDIKSKMVFELKDAVVAKRTLNSNSPIPATTAPVVVFDSRSRSSPSRSQASASPTTKENSPTKESKPSKSCPQTQTPSSSAATVSPRINEGYRKSNSSSRRSDLNSNVPLKHELGNPPLPAQAANKFYFGMNENPQPTVMSQGTALSKHNGTAFPAVAAAADVLRVRPSEQGLKSERDPSSTKTTPFPNKIGQSSFQGVKSHTKTPHNEDISSSSHKSETESENLRQNTRQTPVNVKSKQLGQRGRGVSAHDDEDSSSDLNSSEMDIPLHIRPTLPQKRNELPSFSPVAAWHALDSPHHSGRSISSEDGFRYERRIQRNTRPIAPHRNGGYTQERSGDSGISAGDGTSPANPFPRIQGAVKTDFGHPNKCWTPQQDLDDSSSDFEAEPESKVTGHRSVPLVPVSIGPQTPPKLTTRSHVFTVRQNVSSGDEKQNHRWRQGPPERLAKRMAKNSRQRAENNRSSLGFDGNANWSLSRSEPNSLHEVDAELMLSKQLPLDSLGYSSRGDDHPFPAGSPEFDVHAHAHGMGSDIGYGPSSMNFQPNHNPKYEKNGNTSSEPNSLILFRRPLHIMYLPAYDSRRIHSNPRRSKSVDNLDAGKSGTDLFVSTRTHAKSHRSLQRNSSSSNEPSPLAAAAVKPKTNTTASGHRATPNRTESEEATRRKFKFQSTLRVLERKRMEKELSEIAKEREIQRVREAEELRRVEEEFQRKRSLRKIEIPASSGGDHTGWGHQNPKNESKPACIGMSLAPWDSVVRTNVIRTYSGSENSLNTSSTAPSHDFRKASYGQGKQKYGKFKVSLSQRQDPDGAPSPSAASDLRKELIHASRKRNGVGNGNGSSGCSDLTQELSEYRQETRQYCDYRRNPRNSTSSPTRPEEPWEKHRSSNRSRTTTVHPEVVCDIPGRRQHYGLDSRLGGSLSNLISDSTGIGTKSGPSSVISDNYRRDWAHKGSCGSSVGGIGGEHRASSVLSLHSAPGFRSDYNRNSVNDFSDRVQSPRIFQEKRSTNQNKRSSKSRSSPQPQHIMCNSSTSNESSVIGLERSLPPSLIQQPPGVFQPQPFNSNKTKEYRPVVFKPKAPQHPSSFAIIHGVNY